MSSLAQPSLEERAAATAHSHSWSAGSGFKSAVPLWWALPGSFWRGWFTELHSGGRQVPRRVSPDCPVACWDISALRTIHPMENWYRIAGSPSGMWVNYMYDAYICQVARVRCG